MPSRSSLPLASSLRNYSCPSLHILFLYSSAAKPPIRIFRPLCSLRTGDHGTRSHNIHRVDHRNPIPTAPWINQWSPCSLNGKKVAERNGKYRIRSLDTEEKSEADAKLRYLERDTGQSAIERIVLRLRNLDLGSDDEDEDEEESRIIGRDANPTMGEGRLDDLLRREWVRPDFMLAEDNEGGDNDDDMLMPWEKNEEEETAQWSESVGVAVKKRRAKAPSLAELTVEDSELRRLRGNGMCLREKINVPKAGLTEAVMDKIHHKWRKEELVRLKFHEVLARDMKTAHEIVERRTGGLIIWRAGSIMVVYRGSNYQGPSMMSDPAVHPGETLVVSDVSSASNESSKAEENQARPHLRNNMTEEESEINSLLDSLGPRFHEWWGTGVLPVNADLLPLQVPGYQTPFRRLPTGVRSILSSGEVTNLRKEAKALPSHFALGRNRNHQGLAAAILKLWEKSLVVKIAVKRGIQNTNNKLMADELKKLTGGVLLLRNKYYIVMYRGKDFLPSSVAATLAEREELTKKIQDVEERVRNREIDESRSAGDAVPAQAGTLEEFYEAQARWGREISPDEREKMIKEASTAAKAKIVKRIQHKQDIAQAKLHRAEKLLSRVEASMIPTGPDFDQEVISEEERVMFRKVGLKMKAYLPLGIRGVFDGVIENMHLHWKHREVVKLITKQKNLSFVEDTARLLEYESGGVLVATVNIPKGYALIYYRGKNYSRPVSLRPRNLLTKAKALKHSIAIQRHEALSQHISELEKAVEEMKKELNPSYIEDRSERENLGGDEKSR